MSGLVAWGVATLMASTVLMLLVLAVRAPLRRWVGPQLCYALWALPAMRLILPPTAANAFGGLPMAGIATSDVSVLLIGPHGPSRTVYGWGSPAIGEVLLALWLVGALCLFAVYAVRHLAFCHWVRVEGTEFGRVGSIRIVAADVQGPLAFGVLRRFIAVPRHFARDYQDDERDLALAHERAHHARGDLIASWASLAVLAAHWWNPVAWVAIRAFRDDQEFAADAHVLAGKEPSAIRLYAHVLAKAAGVCAPPACNLNARPNLKGRLMMLRQSPPSSRQLVLGGIALILFGGTALAATLANPGAAGSATGGQATTIGVKPDNLGGYALIIDGRAVASHAPLPGGLTLPADFKGAGGCDLKQDAKPFAMVIKGVGTTRTYTVMCASAAPAPFQFTLAEGLASLKRMRASVATQRELSFPEVERTHALGAIERSIREVEAMLASNG